MKSKTVAAIALLVAVALLPGTSALSGDVAAQEISIQATEGLAAADDRGVELFHLSLRNPNAAPIMTLEAGALWGYQFEADRLTAAPNDISIGQFDLGACYEDSVGVCHDRKDLGSKDAPLSDIKASLVRADPAFLVQTLGSAMGLEVGTGSLYGVAMDGARLDPSAERPIDRNAGATVPTQRYEFNPNPSVFVTNDNVVGVTTLDMLSTVTITGSFMVEFYGLEWRLEDAQGSQNMVSGREYHAQQAGMTTYTDRLLRLFVEDATLTMELPGAYADPGQNIMQWTATRAHWTAQDAAVEMSGATGALRSPQGEVQLEDDRLAYEGPIDMILGSDGEALQTTVDEPEATADTTIKPAGTFSSTWLWALAGAMILGIAVTATVRTLRTPQIHQVEAALEAAHFRKAASLSTRILRKDPTMESAQLSRAIAWSRSGRNHKIVKTLVPFLRRHEPRDGTLHYVLGLALKDLGEEEDARAMMAEAVHRTPSLLAEVDPMLRPHGDHNDAQAYT